MQGIARRMHERGSVSDGRVAVGRAAGPLASGCVDNVSKSGVLVRVSGRSGITHGDVVRLVFARDTVPHRARVVRVEHRGEDDHRETALGCRWIGGSGRRPPLRRQLVPGASAHALRGYATARRVEGRMQ
ncbi:MAG: hypothetical protein RBS39_13025 [Phycisphaerales bacterium]|jgi:hypothetical protein|nr:hypothetical protein [Phycisphaerales bacterium]